MLIASLCFELVLFLKSGCAAFPGSATDWPAALTYPAVARMRASAPPQRAAVRG
jgi:hypothetical protein